MAAKDRYGNNIRRGARVADLVESGRQGEITATNTNVRGRVIVQWDNADEEEEYPAHDLVLADRSFR
jgi:hypothetical protein